MDKQIELYLIEEIKRLSRNKLILRMKKKLKKLFPRSTFHSFRGPLGFYPDKRDDLFVHIDIFPANHVDTLTSTVTLFNRFKPEGMSRKVAIRPLTNDEGDLYSKQVIAPDIDTSLQKIKSYIDEFKNKSLQTMLESIAELNGQLKFDLANQFGHEFLSTIANKFVKTEETPFATKLRTFNDENSKQSKSEYYTVRLDEPFKHEIGDRKHNFKRGFYILESSPVFEDRIISGEWDSEEEGITFQVQKLETLRDIHGIELQYVPGIIISDTESDFRSNIMELYNNDKAEETSIYIKFLNIMSKISSTRTREEIARQFAKDMVEKGDIRMSEEESFIQRMMKDANDL